MNVLTIIRYIGYIPQLAGLILSAVAFVEGIMAGGTGPDKKQAVLTSVETAWASLSAETGITKPFSEIAPLVSILIDLCVAIFNLFWKPKQ